MPERGVTIDPVGIQTPPGPATGIGLADGAADSLGLGDVASGDAVATAITDGSGTGGTTVGSRRRPEPAANAPPTSTGLRPREASCRGPGRTSVRAEGRVPAIAARAICRRLERINALVGVGTKGGREAPLELVEVSHQRVLPGAEEQAREPAAGA